jgi:hypothetical protein
MHWATVPATVGAEKLVPVLMHVVGVEVRQEEPDADGRDHYLLGTDAWLSTTL